MTPQDFIQAVPTLRERMTSTARRYLMEAADAEDVVQDVMIRLWERKERFPSTADMQRYSLEAVKNTALNVLRQRKLHPSTPVEYLLESGAQSESALSERTELFCADDSTLTMEQRLMKAVRRLPQRDRDLIRLRNIEDLPYPDIARLLGLSEVNVRVRLSRLRIALIKQIKSTPL